MRVFIIPSWFPSPSHPNAGIFFKEQADLYAKCFSLDQVGLVSWGQNDQRLLLERSQLLKIPEKLLGARKLHVSEVIETNNFVTWFYPRYTWTRKVLDGNIKGITKACEQSFLDFTTRYGQPEVIHAHVGYPGGYIAWKLSEKYKVPFVITEHMGPFPFSDFKIGAGLDTKLLNPLKHAHKVLAVSEHLKHEMEPFGITSSVFHNFIDDNYFNVEDTQFKRDKVQLLHIGRLAPEKRQADLLKAAALLSSSMDFELVIAGEGALKPELQTLTNDLSLQDRVKFKGNLNRGQIREQIQTADLVILSSSYENFPVSILEALACGKPVVATRCGGPQEMINEVNGLLTNTFDSADLAEKIKQVISAVQMYDPVEIRADFESRYGQVHALQKLREVYQRTLDDYHSK